MIYLKVPLQSHNHCVCHIPARQRNTASANVTFTPGLIKLSSVESQGNREPPPAPQMWLRSGPACLVCLVFLITGTDEADWRAQLLRSAKICSSHCTTNDNVGTNVFVTKSWKTVEQLQPQVSEGIFQPLSSPQKIHELCD